MIRSQLSPRFPLPMPLTAGARVLHRVAVLDAVDGDRQSRSSREMCAAKLAPRRPPRCPRKWQSREGVDDDDAQRAEMFEVARQDCQSVMPCRSGDDDVSESGRLALAPRPIDHRAGGTGPQPK